MRVKKIIDIHNKNIFIIIRKMGSRYIGIPQARSIRFEIPGSAIIRYTPDRPIPLNFNNLEVDLEIEWFLTVTLTAIFTDESQSMMRLTWSGQAPNQTSLFCQIDINIISGEYKVTGASGYFPGMSGNIRDIMSFKFTMTGIDDMFPSKYIYQIGLEPGNKFLVISVDTALIVLQTTVLSTDIMNSLSSVNTSANALNTTSNNISSNDIPMITIYAVDAFSSRDFAAVQYTVIDKFPYGSCECNFKKILSHPKRYESSFFTFPGINPVVKGSGCFLVDQFQEIIKHFHLDIGITEFAAKMALYALSKYILTFLLYGKFSLKFLTSTFNDKFMHDLRNSRFRKFEIIYVDPQFGLIGFERYFRKTLKCELKK